jgi:hypothetical protein
VGSYTYALVAAVAMLLVLPVALAVFKTPFKFIDVVLAAIVAGATSLIPVVGGPVSFLATLFVLNWRLPVSWYPDIFYPVGIARLASIPVILLLQHR